MSMEPSETIEHAGCTIKIYRDDWGEGPREWDNVGTMVCFHGRYSLGDEHDFADPDDLREFLEENPEAVALPLYLYDHGGITMNTAGFGCPWDSGQVGVIYILPEKIKEEWGVGEQAIEKAVSCLRGEVVDYDNFLQGNVYGYMIEDEDGEDIGASCWGFYPDRDDNGLEPKQMIEEAKAEAEAYRADADKAEAEVNEQRMIEDALAMEEARSDMYTMQPEAVL